MTLALIYESKTKIKTFSSSIFHSQNMRCESKGFGNTHWE